VQETDGEPVATRADFRKNTAVPGQADAQKLVGAFRVKHLFEAALMRDFLSTPGRFPHQAIMGIDTFGEQSKLVKPAFHLELAFFMRLL